MGRWGAEWPRSVHFIGIGGVAMSALATLLAGRGVKVRGSDRAVYPPVSEILAAHGIEVLSPFSPGNLSGPVDLVVVGNAVSRGNPELEQLLDTDLSFASLPEVIERLLLPGRRRVVVAGTHGKTTTTSMVAFLLDAVGRDPSFLIGGRPGNFSVGGRLGQGPELILEGDEYDSAFFDKGPKFLHYWPDVAILGPVEFDHADIYADLAAVERAFSWFVRVVPPGGTLVVHGDDPAARSLAREGRCRLVTTGFDPHADIRAVDHQENDQGQRFTVLAGGRAAGEVRLSIPGIHNARNALAALAAVEAVGVELETAIRQFPGFRPPSRRLEPILESEGVTLYDDFAHHPTAVRHTLETVRRFVHPGGRLVACLEPRSNTMVRSVVREALEEALALADRVWLGEVDRPERFSAAERLDVEGLVAALRSRGLAADGPLGAGAIAAGLLAERRSGDRVVLMSNGPFGGLRKLLQDRFAERGKS